MKKFSIFFRTALVSTLVSLALCSPSSAKKTNTQNIPFGEKDFANAVKTVKENYIDKNIDENRAYTDAAIFAMLSMPQFKAMSVQCALNVRTSRYQRPACDLVTDQIDTGAGFRFQILSFQRLIVCHH